MRDENVTNAAAFRKEIDDVVKKAMQVQVADHQRDIRREAKRLPTVHKKVVLQRTDAMDNGRSRKGCAENLPVVINYEIIGVTDDQCRPVVVTPRTRQACIRSTRPNSFIIFVSLSPSL